MDEEQEMERFNMENDYEELHKIGNEYYGKRREKRPQTKEEALYGYESSSDSDKERKRKKRRDIIYEDRSSKPMNFVPGRVQSVGSSGEDSQVRADDSPARPGLGSGFSSKHEDSDSSRPGLGAGDDNSPEDSSGLGFGNGYGRSGKKDEDDGDFLPTAFGKRILENANARRAKKLPKAKPGTEAEVKWENHSTGFASRMMEKFGWIPGKGLGKDEQGISEAVEVTLRAKNTGLGFGEFDKPKVRPIETKQEEKPRTTEKAWLKVSKKTKPAKNYISAEELLATEGGSRVTKVLDMTGRQARVVTDLKNLSMEQRAAEDDTPMPELQYNVRLIVDLVAADIRNFDAKRRHEQQSIEYLQRDRERLQYELDSQSSRLQALQTIVQTIQGIGQDSAAALKFGQLKSDYPDEYKMWNLSALALSHALPFVVSRFHGWQPLFDPTRGVDLLSLWKEVLDEVNDAIFFEETMDGSPYTRLVIESVLPHIRTAVTNWEVRAFEPMLRFIEIWDKLLPGSVLRSILDHLVLPKLNFEVEAWNPTQDPVPIHVWIHPWLPYLGTKMEYLCGIIRLKLDSVLRVWDPSDDSALILLSPWRQVFDATSWEQLMARHIVPKLKLALDTRLIINPSQQRMEPFYWVIAWSEVMPIQYMVRLLDESFFPRWLEILYLWLRADPNLAEVADWYKGWKASFPPLLAGNESVRGQLDRAVEMMNQCIEEVEIQNPKLAPRAPPRSEEKPQRVFAEEAVEMSLKEMVESFAQESSVPFRPKPGRMHDGLQVYGFGAVSISVDNHKQVILAQSGEQWVSVSMHDLLQMHHAKKGGKWNS